MDSIDRQLAARGLRLDQQSVDAIDRLQDRGQLSLGWPNRNCVLDSLVWRPACVDHNFRTTAIVSSRLGRQVDRLDPIFRVLRCAISQLDPNRQQVVSSVGTTTHRYVTRACELFDVPLLRVFTANPKQSLDRWLQSCLDLQETGQITDESTQAHQNCFVSNPICTAAKQPIRDEIENLASDQLLVLHARADGNLNQLLRQRLASTPNELQKSRTYLALGNDKLVPQEVATELMSQGAIGWLPIPNSDVQTCPMDWTLAAKSPIWNDLPNPDRFFIHCTRRAAGAWPDQADTEFLDELILGHPARDRSSLAALSRIVRMQTLLAAHDSIRDATPVVSFTEAPIDKLVDMRTYRAHRGRWDFEPYGIAIDRDWLISQGARKVIYGDEQKWRELSESDRPLYQKIGDQPNAIDWTVEREWRVVGDVDFSGLPDDKAAVFVPTREEANQLSRISAWPIIVLPS